MGSRTKRKVTKQTNTSTKMRSRVFMGFGRMAMVRSHELDPADSAFIPVSYYFQIRDFLAVSPFSHFASGLRYTAIPQSLPHQHWLASVPRVPRSLFENDFFVFVISRMSRIRVASMQIKLPLRRKGTS